MPNANKLHGSNLMVNNTSFGNACSVVYDYTFAASAIGTRVDLDTFPAGTELQEIEVINDNLGASTTLAIGELFAAGDGTTSANSLKAATATSAAGKIDANFHPRILSKPMTPTLTVGGAAATGKISVIVRYSYVGDGQ
jgi:hypothetical protein